MTLKTDFELYLHHASMQFSDNHDQRRSDLRNILKRRPKAHVITFTEMADKTAMNDLRVVNKELPIPFQILKPDEGDIAFAVTAAAKLINASGRLSIPGQRGPASLGGHGPRYNSFVTFALNGETITHHGVHFVTAHSHHKHGGPLRTDQQNKQAADLVQMMRMHSEGRRIATGSGDLNIDAVNDPRHVSEVDRIFDEAGVLTTSEEMAGRHEHVPHSIDFIWTLDRDSRVSCKTTKKHHSPALHTDHDDITATLDIRVGHGLR